MSTRRPWRRTLQRVSHSGSTRAIIELHKIGEREESDAYRDADQEEVREGGGSRAVLVSLLPPQREAHEPLHRKDEP